MTVVERLDSLGAHSDPVDELGHERGDNKETLHALLDLPPVGTLEVGRDEDGVEVEVGSEEGAGEDRRRAKVRGLDGRLEVPEGLAVEGGERLGAGLVRQRVSRVWEGGMVSK